MTSSRIIDVIRELKDTKERMSEELTRIQQQIEILESTLTDRDREIAGRGGYIYYVKDVDIIRRAKVGMTSCGDENRLRSRYRTGSGGVDVLRFKQVSDRIEAERELLDVLRQNNLMWSQQDGRINAGTELIANTTLSLEIFDDIVNKFSP